MASRFWRNFVPLEGSAALSVATVGADTMARQAKRARRFEFMRLEVWLGCLGGELCSEMVPFLFLERVLSYPRAQGGPDRALRICAERPDGAGSEQIGTRHDEGEHEFPKSGAGILRWKPKWPWCDTSHAQSGAKNCHAFFEF